MSNLKNVALTKDEALLLVQLVGANKMVTNKQTNATNNALKEKAWFQITEQFNSSISSCPRETRQLKLKWENLKKAARKRSANIRINQFKEEPASSGDSGDESGSEPESPTEKLMHMHKQDCYHELDRERENKRDNQEPHASTSSTTQEADSSKSSQPSLPKLLPKIEMPGGAMLYPGVLGLDGIGNNLGLGNLAMSYPHSFILGLANQGQEGSSSSGQPQFITIPLSMAMAAANPAASSDDSSELQDLTTARK